MAYEKQTFVDRVTDERGNVVTEGTTLKAEHLNHMEAGMVEIEKKTFCTGWTECDMERVDGAAVYTAVGKQGVAKNEGGNFSYAKANVANCEKIRVSGYQWEASYGYYLVAFENSSGKIISVYEAGDSGTYSDCEVDVPDGAVFAYINGNANGIILCSGYKKYDVSTLQAEKADRVAKWSNLPAEWIDGSLKYNGGGIHTQGDGCYTEVNIEGIKQVRVKSWQWASTNFFLCQFRDSAGTLISSHYGDPLGATVTLTLDVPTNAKTMLVNGKKYGRPEIMAYKTYDIADVYADLKHPGKKLITLGDSITALGTGSTGWVKYFLEKTECQLVANVAVNGAWLHDKEGTVYDGNPVFNGEDENVNNVLGNQVQKILNNGYEAPDIILIAIGTNAGIQITKEDMSKAYYDENKALIPLENVDRTTSAGAYRWCLEKLQEAYPNAIIFWCTPIMGYQGTRSAEAAMDYAESLRIATEYSGQILIDTIRCGINGVKELSGENGWYLADGLHPNANGAKKIGYYNASKVMPFLGNGFVMD